jgi:hypothetical protein
MPDETTRLTWIPMGSPHLRPPKGLSPAEVGCWWDIFWAMFDYGEPQGYLPLFERVPSAALHNLPHRLQVTDLRWWNAHRDRIVAAFELSEIAGKQTIFFPPLIDALAAQRKKLRARGLPRANDNSLCVSQSVFDFDLKKSQEKICADSSSKKPATNSGTCPRHPESGRTQWGTCWDCYAERCG